ncbi:GL20613 [Drosophila persimilis]|uniref:GL20613 n=2 Tax=Drosophila persimilis TaxID=7234 RepID=B4G5P5_DROPE|nr:GL20613 [Drosophila persimilis]
MDESDSPSPQMQQTTSRVFCCGDTSPRGPKLLRVGPGQAVQVITMQKDEISESEAKKQKIAQVQL